jgi:hypothetical protein
MKKLLYLALAALIFINFASCNKDKEDEINLPKTSISGQVLNSQTGEGLANATLNFYMDQNKSSDATDLGRLIFTVITDSEGYYSTEDAFAGTFTLTITASNFYTETVTNFVISVDPDYNDFDPITITQEMGAGDGVMRIVLTWGDDPSDLDSHLTGPQEGTTDRFHCYYSDQDPNETVNLDVDDTYYYGPETTTILNWVNGKYTYSVHNYSYRYSEGGALNIYNSPTTIRVYSNTGLIHTYVAPATVSGPNNTWKVFEINVVNGTPTITSINTYVTAEGSSDTEAFKNGTTKKGVMLDSSDF